MLAFMGIKDAAARYEIINLVERMTRIDKYSESLGSFSTGFSRDWIEALTGFDPDNHSGSFEWTIVAALFLVSILLSIAACADWRRLGATAPTGI